MVLKKTVTEHPIFQSFFLTIGNFFPGIKYRKTKKGSIVYSENVIRENGVFIKNIHLFLDSLINVVYPAGDYSDCFVVNLLTSVYFIKKRELFIVYFFTNKNWAFYLQALWCAASAMIF